MTNNPVPSDKSFVYAFSTAKLVLLLCMVLVLIALSLMLGIRIERYQRTAEVTRQERQLSQPAVRTTSEAVPPKRDETPDMSFEAIPAAPEPLPQETAAKVDSPMPISQPDSKTGTEASGTVVPAEAEVTSKPSSEEGSTVPPKQESAPRGHYAVQVFSTQERATADAHISSLKKKGFESYIEDIDLGSKGRYFRVMVGPFDTEARAKDVQSKLAKESDFASSYVRYLP